MDYLPIIIEFVAGLVIGLSVGFFAKVSLRIVLFFLGFYVLLTAGLVYLGVLSVNVTVDQLAYYLTTMKGNSEMLEILKQHIGFIAGTVIGFLVGFFKIRIV